MEHLFNLKDTLARFWRGLSPVTRIGLAVYMFVFASLLIAMAFKSVRRVEVKQEIVEAPAPAPVVAAPAEIPKEIVIDSADTAALADILSDDDSTSVTTSGKVDELQMLRIANDWLAPQVDLLNRKAKALKRSIDKDEKYLGENRPLVDPVRNEVADLEQHYKRANAALDLPVMPNSSFNEEMEDRFKDVRARLDKARKRLKSLENGVGAVERRLESNNLTLPQLEVEANEAGIRLEKIRARDPKVVAITYAYAMAGLTGLPLLRFLGRGVWDARLINDISRAFEIEFRRSLPVSAYGQSNTHDRLGWDHSHAVDVAVSPSSTEGQWLISYLRSKEIPFIAFRRAVPGVSTGAHVHIGTASQRLSR